MSNQITKQQGWRFDLTPAQKQDVDRVQFAIEAINSDLNQARCESQEDLDDLTDIQSKLKGFRLEASKIINPIKAEINEEKSRILGIEAAVVKAAKEGEDRCGTLCGAYRAKLAEEQRRLEEQARKDAEEARQAQIAEEAAAIEEEEGIAAAEAYRESAQEEALIEPEVYQLVNKPKNTQLRYTYKAEVVDISKVPAKYLKVDQKLIDAEARAFKDSFDIPGCRLVKSARQASVRG